MNESMKNFYKVLAKEDPKKILRIELIRISESQSILRFRHSSKGLISVNLTKDD